VFTVKGTTVSNLVICLVSEEARIDTGKTLAQAYTTKMQTYGGVLRFSTGPNMTNTVMQCNWADRPKTTQITYGGRFFAGKKCGANSGTQNAIVLGAPSNPSFPASATHGTIIHFHCAAANTSTSVTLQVGTWAAKSYTNAYNPSTASLPAGLTLNTNTAIFDATLDKWVACPGVGAFGNNWYGLIGHPWEALIAECNEVGSPGWFSIPFWASDDYVTQLATLISNTYQPSTVYFEYVNEIWNTAFGFPFTNIAATYGNLTFGLGVGNGANYSGWYGYRMRQINALVKAVLGGKAKTLLMSQGASGDDPATLTNVVQNTRFQQAGVPALAGANAPINNCDEIGYAYYFSSASTAFTDTNYNKFGLPGAPNLRTMVDQWLAGNTNTAFSSMRDDFLTNVNGGGANRFSNWNGLAASPPALASPKPVRLYEMNWEVGPPSAAWCGAGASCILYANSNRILTATPLNHLTAASWSGGVVTATTTTAHGWVAGQTILIYGNAPTAYNGTFVLQAGTTGSTIKYNLVSDPGTNTTLGNIAPAVQSLGILFLTSTTQGGGDTLSSAGLYGQPQNAKNGNPITGATLLSGATGTDSVPLDFAAGNTITVNSQTITFMASGASGNNQVNITDSITALLGKIDIATGTSTPSIVRSAPFDSSYGDQSGKIWKFIEAFYQSAQAVQMWESLLKTFKSYSQSAGASIFAAPGVVPWISAPLRSDTDTYADFTAGTLGNWDAFRLSNNSKRRMIIAT
jgi:hypothetical protein